MILYELLGNHLKEIIIYGKECCMMEKTKKFFKEHKKRIGWIIILIGITVACAINLL